MPCSSKDNGESNSSSRRTFLRASGAAGVAGLAGSAGCLSIFGRGGGKPTINIVTWNSYTTLTEELESRFDANIEMTATPSSSKMFSAWNSGKDKVMDIAFPNNNYVPKFMEANLIAPVMLDQISYWDSMYESFRTFAQTQLSNNGAIYGVPMRFGWYGYNYDSRAVPDHEPSYEILFNPTYTGKDLSGKIVMKNVYYKAMTATALHLGYRDAFKGKSITLSQSQLDELTQTMIEQKKILQGYITTDNNYIKNMKQNNFEVGQASRNDTIIMKANGYDWPTMASPKEGTTAWYEAGIVSKKSKHKKLAWQIVNEFLAPKLGAKLASAGTAYIPITNPDVKKHLKEKNRRLIYGISPSILNKMIPFKPLENEKAWVKAWEEIKAA